MTNGMENDLEFKKLIEGFLETDNPKEWAREIMYMIHRNEKKQEQAKKDRDHDCSSQYHSCSNRHRSIDNEIDKIKDRQQPSMLLTRIFQCLPPWAQKMVIIGAALYLILFSFGVTAGAIYLQSKW